MKKTTKIALALIIVLVVAAVPLYFYTRPTPVQEGTFQIKGQVSNPLNVTLNQLQTFTPVTVQVTISSSGQPSANGVFNYTGVPLGTLLEQAHISSNDTSVYIQASDGYGTTISIQDAMMQNTIIAYQKDSKLLTPLKNGGEGPFRLIIGNDQYAQRWVEGVVVIEVS
ncbi:MAG: molybdopterin-dependent oxidoreductase [Candidatus Bathyarchaeia archaeon]|jgi:DMSO/TMAO reductase YedYZ molybdopterin-dependent catalytic subunit